MSDLGIYMEAVARALLGAPNVKLSNEKHLRYGSNGSLSVDLTKGVWHDHENNEGGGVLDLIHREKGLDVGGALDWMREDLKLDVGEPKRTNGEPAISVDFAEIDQVDPGVMDLDPEENKHEEAATREQAAIYNYVDESGKLLYQTLRYVFRKPDGTLATGADGKPKKTFLQRQPIGKAAYINNGLTDEWAWNLKGVRLVPYRLPQLIEALGENRVVFLVEGEKCVDLLRYAGVPATCNPMGAGKWPAEFTKIFKCADTVTLPDNDEAGRKHADIIGASLNGVAAANRVLDLPGLSPKGDIEDWLSTGNTIDQLHVLADKAPLWSPAPIESKFGAVTWGEPRPAMVSYEYLIKGIVPRREAVMIVGGIQSGKSFWTQSMAMAVTRGVDFMGRKTRQGLVVYCAAEAGVGFADLRMPAYGIHHNLAPSGRLPFVCLTKKFDLFGDERQLDELIAEIKEHEKRHEKQLEVVAIDTLNKTTPGMDEIHGKDVGLVISRLDRIREECNCGLWLVHHKNAANTGPRGHTSLLATFETAIEITAGGLERDINPAGGPGRMIRTAKLLKQREGEEGVTWRFVLRRVVVGVDEDGDERSSCVVTAPAGESHAPAGAKKADPQAASLSEEKRNILRSLRDAITEYGEVPPLDLPRSITRVVKVARWYEVYRRTASEENEATVRQRMKRANDTLLDRRVIGRSNPYVWLTGRPVAGVIEGRPDRGAPELLPAPDDVEEFK